VGCITVPAAGSEHSYVDLFGDAASSFAREITQVSLARF